jgi:hypothetical protein
MAQEAARRMNEISDAKVKTTPWREIEREGQALCTESNRCRSRRSSFIPVRERITCLRWLGIVTGASLRQRNSPMLFGAQPTT